MKNSVVHVNFWFLLWWITAFVLFCATGVIGADMNNTMTLNESDLPYTDFIDLNLSLIPTHTIFLEKISFSSFINFSFPSHLFLENSSDIIFRINYTIEDFGISDDVVLSNSFLIRNSYNSLNSSYDLFFEILNDEYVINQSFCDNLSVVRGGYEKTLSVNNLPQTEELNFLLKGTSNAIINISCGRWLSCPNTDIFNSSGDLVVPITYLIPFNVTIGTYESNIIFVSNNVTQIGMIRFNIILPEITLDYYIWTSKCFEGNTYEELTENYELCLNEESEFYAHQKSELIMELLLQKFGNATVEPEVVIEKEYVVVADLNKTVWDLYTVCNENLVDCQPAQIDCVKSLDSCQRELNDGISNLQNKAFEQKVSLENKNKLDLKSQISSVRNWIIFLTIMVLIFIGIKKFLKVRKESYLR